MLTEPFYLLVTSFWIMYMGTYWIMSSIYYIIDVLSCRYPFIRKWKIQEDRQIDFKQYHDTARVVLSNQLLSFPFVVMLYPLISLRCIDSTLTLPSLRNFISNIISASFVFDILFYIGHRILHHKPLYGMIHKQHHLWTSPVAVAAHYAHPIEHILINTLLPTLSIIMTGDNMITIWIWFVLATLSVTSTHSGYIYAIAKKHDDHHRYFNVNYGIFITDYIFGTNH